MATKRKRLSKEEMMEGILSGNRMILSRAITLVESALPDDREQSEDLLNELLPKTGNSFRIGITGVPGVGKSTFIESFGLFLCEQGFKVAVLAIDPSSQRTSGSILGDKTRMEQLSHHPSAYIRPSPTSNSLGGVANKTRETMLLCEAAGFDVILIETVGVGQSETAVKGMVDFFLLLMLAGAGDELQGIKKGIMEMADGIAITKADGDNIKHSKQARIEYQNALHLFPPSESGWYPKVLTCSSVANAGLDDIWQMINEYKEKLSASGYLVEMRKKQNIDWMNESIKQGLLHQFFSDEKVKSQLKDLTEKVANGELTPQSAARKLIQDNSKSA